MRFPKRLDLAIVFAPLAVFCLFFVVSCIVASIVVQPQVNRSEAEGRSIVSEFPGTTMNIPATIDFSDLNLSSSLPDTRNTTIIVSTDSLTGYTLTVNMLTDETCLRNANDFMVDNPCGGIGTASKFQPVLTDTITASFAPGYWGISTVPYTTWNPVPASSSAPLELNYSVTDVVDDVTHIRIGVNADYSIAASSYLGSVVFTATPNLQPIPIITGVDPTSGRSGDPVTVTGLNFTFNSVTILSEVLFGEDPCDNLDIVSSTFATCDVPDGIDGELFLTAVSVFGNEEPSEVVFATIPDYNGVDIGLLDASTCDDAVPIGTIYTMHDPRGSGQDYRIRCMEDGNYWMINNLKLGSTSSTTPLTPSDTNILSNWSLPQLNTGTGMPNAPQAMALLSGDPAYSSSTPNSVESDITSNNFAGYSYNWCAATGGGTASGGSNTCTMTLVTPDQPTGDICPVGWRLPSGDSLGDFAILNGSMQAGSPAAASTATNYSANWRPGGPFHGVLAGYFANPPTSAWSSVNANGSWWSSSLSSLGAFSASVDSMFVYIAAGTGSTRDVSRPIRCMMPNTPTMQSVNIETCPTIPTALLDERDNHYYMVQKLADGKCWMLTNLAYGGSEAGTELLSGEGQMSTSGIPASATNWNDRNPPYNNQKQWVDPSNTSVSLLMGARCVVSFRTSAASVNYTECGYRYNWCAALGNASSYCDSSTSGLNIPNAGEGVCPDGWRLPTSGSSGGEFQAMYTAVGGTPGSLPGGLSSWRTGSNYFMPGIGLVNDNQGRYISSTVNSSIYTYFAYIGSSVDMNDVDLEKNYGWPVRCLIGQ